MNYEALYLYHTCQEIFMGQIRSCPDSPWWRHQMETFSVLLAICAVIKGQWRGTLMFSLICARINGWVNNGEAGDLRRHRAHCYVTVMLCPHGSNATKMKKGRWEAPKMNMWEGFFLISYFLITIIARSLSLVFLAGWFESRAPASLFQPVRLYWFGEFLKKSANYWYCQFLLSNPEGHGHN